MTLISMLLALIIERLAVRSDAWQASPYCQAYQRLTAGGPLHTLATHRWGQLLWVLLPGAVVALLLCLIDNSLITLIVNTLVLLLGIGCWHLRTQYKQYLNAQERGDVEAADITMQQMAIQIGSKREQNSYGQLLVWLNFRYYAAVVFWFLLLGSFGVITYALLRYMQEGPVTVTTVDTAAATDAPDQADEYATADAIIIDAEANADVANTATAELVRDPEHEPEPVTPAIAAKTGVQYLMHWADWFPARLFGLGFALVGHFSRASSALLSYFLDFTADNEQVVIDVATAAEPIPEEQRNTVDETSYMVQLAKRNMLFFLAFTAILTLSGWLN